MSVVFPRKSTCLVVLALLACLSVSDPLLAQPATATNIWTQPSSSPGGDFNWSTGPWDIVPTVGGTNTTVLQFDSTSVNGFSALNDLGSPSSFFRFNTLGIILNGSSPDATITLDDVGSNQITLTGIDPFVYQVGASPVTIQGILRLQPSSGTTTFGGNGTGTITINNSLVGQGGFTKTGTGTLVLNQSTSFLGGVVVNGGAVRIVNSDENSATGSGAITIQSGGTFMGNGSVKPSAGNGIMIQSGGTLSPGDGEDLGQLSVTTNSGNVTFNAGSRWGIHLGTPVNDGEDAAPDSGSNSEGDPFANAGFLLFNSDTGTLTLNPDTTVVLSGNPSNFNRDQAYSFQVGFVPFESSGSVIELENFDTSGFMTLTTASLNVVDDKVFLNFTTPVPEPTSLFAAVTAGLGLITGLRSLKRRRGNPSRL